MELKEYQLEIVNRAMSVFLANYDSYDLEELMYSGLELESEIFLILIYIHTNFYTLYWFFLSLWQSVCH